MGKPKLVCTPGNHVLTTTRVQTHDNGTHEMQNTARTCYGSFGWILFIVVSQHFIKIC